MKSILLLYVCLANSIIAASQEMSLNKAQTVDFLNKQYKLSEGGVRGQSNDAVTIKDCEVTLSRGMLTISHSEYDNNKLYRKATFQFSPLNIEAIRDRRKAHTGAGADSLSSMDIYFKTKTCISKSKYFDSNEEYYNNNTVLASLDYFYQNGKGFDKFEQALLHLQKLLQAEADPFELSAQEQRLSVLFAKYKRYEGGERPTSTYAGSTVLAEDISLVLNGPKASYSGLKTKTYLKTDTKQKNSFSYEFWWSTITSVKYNVVAGALFIKGTEKSVDYKMVDLLTNKPFKNEGSDLVAFFKLAADDKDGETRKDVMEVISLIKKIVKDYGGSDLKVEINEE